ncbi:MAG: hypothetical protein ACOYOA_10535 [Saprospiraceae bacterium]
MQLIKVVIPQSCHWLSELAKQELKSIFADVIVLVNDNPYQLLLAAEADVCLMPLQDTPFHLPAGIVITALRKREDPEYVLILRKDLADENKLLNVPENTAINVPDQLILRSIGGYFTSNSIEINPLNENVPDIAVLPKIELGLRNISPDDYFVHDLHPDEFTPQAGQGSFAWICREDDLELRRMLKKIHSTDTTRCCNTERRIARNWQLAGISGHAYCSVHPTGHYQLNFCILNTAGEIEKEKFSSPVVTGWEQLG